MEEKLVLREELANKPSLGGDWYPEDDVIMEVCTAGAAMYQLYADTDGTVRLRDKYYGTYEQRPGNGGTTCNAEDS